MKRTLALLTLVLTLAILAFTACGRTEDEVDAPPVDVGNVGGDQPAQPPGELPAPPTPVGAREQILAGIPDWPASGQIVFGTSTPTSPNIMVATWDNPAPNAQVRDLIWGGLSTMERNHANEFFPNPIVMVDGNEPTRTINADGSLTLHFEIYTENRFSDGTPITAWHYGASAAFYLSPQWTAIIPTQTWFWELADRTAYYTGESPTLTSVRVYSDSEFSFTWDAEFIPFVWETPLFNSIGPFPVHALGIEVHDDGQGVFITGPGRSTLTNEAVELAINGGAPVFALDADGNETDSIIGGDGFRFMPVATPGPYVFVGRDAASGQLHVRANPYFPGTWDGFRPRIQDVFWRVTPTPQLVDALVLGEIDLVVGQGGGAEINGMLDRAVGGGTHTFINYTRNGYGFLSFHCDWGPTQFPAVRQAIQWLIDREEFAEMFTEGHGAVNHGPYGTGQWWAMEAYDLGFEDMVIWYTYNPTMAVSILEEDGWIYDAAGDPFEAPGFWGPTLATSNIRHKMVDGELMPLHIHWCTFASPNRITDIVDIMLPEPMEAAGFWFTDERTDLALSHRSRGVNGLDAQEFNMFNLGVTFATTWNPWNSFNPDMHGLSNPNFTTSVELFEMAQRMRFMSHITREDRDEWVQAWIEIMVFLNEYVVDIPLYVDIWFDFIPNHLQDWFNTNVWGFPAAIQRAYVTN